MDPVQFPSLDPGLREIGGAARPESAGGAGHAPGPAGASSFGQALDAAIESVSRVQNESDEATRMFAMGREIDLHTVLLQVERADLSFKTMMEVRNKLLDAYREVMRIQI